MKPYDTYKDSGIEWIGEIPIRWEVRKLQFLAAKEKYAFTGGPFGSDLKSEEYTQEGVRIIQLQNIGIGRFLNDYKIFTSNKKADELYSCNIFPEEIIVAKMADPVARACLIPKEDDRYLMASDGIRIKVDSEKANNKYAVYAINSPYFNYEAVRNSEGTTRLRIGLSSLRKLKIILPPIEEQAAIATYLDRKTAEIDALITDKNCLLNLYEEEKTAVINQAVTKGINPKAKMKDSGVEWLGEIPEHWEAVNLKWVSKIYSGGTPSKNNEDYWQNGIIPWLNSGTVNQFYITEPSEFITEEALNNSSAKWIPENSLVIALAGQGKTKGMAAQVMFKSTCNQSMGVIVPNDLIENRFLLYYLVRNYQNIRNLGGGDKRDGINLEMVGGISIPLLPIKEQESIVSHIETESTRIDAKIDKTQKLIELLTEYRTALISEVVTGKIKVMD